MLRRSLGGWMEHHHESGILAQKLALAVAGEHMREGHPVVVPQFLGQSGLVQRLEQLAHDLGACFMHVVLMDNRAAAIARFHRRLEMADATDQHREAAAMVRGDDDLFGMYDALQELLLAQPDALVVPSADGDVSGTLARLRDALGNRW